MRRISFIFGTRPEAVKLCPLILALERHPEVAPHVCVTGQHREMLYQALEAFGVAPDVDLALMRANQSLGSLTARAVVACQRYLARARPDLVLVQGDTTSALGAAMAAAYRRIPVAHVEAGLRTGNRRSPFPEEINRALITRMATYHFAPTEQARRNLLRENVPNKAIFVTGNTVIDALRVAVSKVRQNPPLIPGLPPGFAHAESGRRLVLITAHRRENLGPRLENICGAIAILAQWFPGTDFVYPVHPNPKVREPVYRLLSGQPNVRLIEPLGYLPFVWLMDRCCLILTDSGGVQEEAPALGKPVLVLRDTTERSEAVAAGVARLVGTDIPSIVSQAGELLGESAAYAAMVQAASLYGDGRACQRIVAALEAVLLGPPSPKTQRGRRKCRLSLRGCEKM